MRQAEKEGRKFQSLISFIVDSGKKTPKIIAKKFKKLKYLFPALFFAKTRKRQKISVLTSIHTRSRQENSKKNQKIKKPLSSIIFRENGMIQAEKEKKKILVPNSVHTRPRQENSTNNSKKIQKIKKPLSGNISSQNGMRQAGKLRKIFQARIPLIQDPGKKIPKKQQKNSKNLKNLFPALFLAKTG